MAFQIKTLGDQDWLLIFQDQKSVREKPQKSHQRHITCAGKKTWEKENLGSQIQGVKLLKASEDGLMRTNGDASDSSVHLMISGGTTSEADTSYSPRAVIQLVHLWIN